MCARFNFSRWPALNSRQTTRANINYSAPWATVSMLELHRAAICPVPETSWPARGPGAPVRRYALGFYGDILTTDGRYLYLISLTSKVDIPDIFTIYRKYHSSKIHSFFRSWTPRHPNFLALWWG